MRHVYHKAYKHETRTPNAEQNACAEYIIPRKWIYFIRNFRKFPFNETGAAR